MHKNVVLGKNKWKGKLRQKRNNLSIFKIWLIYQANFNSGLAFLSQNDWRDHKQSAEGLKGCPWSASTANFHLILHVCKKYFTQTNLASMYSCTIYLNNVLLDKQILKAIYFCKRSTAIANVHLILHNTCYVCYFLFWRSYFNKIIATTVMFHFTSNPEKSSSLSSLTASISFKTSLTTSISFRSQRITHCNWQARCWQKKGEINYCCCGW